MIAYAKSKVRFLLVIWSTARVRKGFPVVRENAEAKKNCTILCMKNVSYVPEHSCLLAFFPLKHPHKVSRFFADVTNFNTNFFVYYLWRNNTCITQVLQHICKFMCSIALIVVWFCICISSCLEIKGSFSDLKIWVCVQCSVLIDYWMVL